MLSECPYKDITLKLSTQLEALGGRSAKRRLGSEVLSSQMEKSTGGFMASWELLTLAHHSIRALQGPHQQESSH